MDDYGDNDSWCGPSVEEKKPESDFYWTFYNTICRHSDPNFRVKMKDMEEGTLIMNTFRELENERD